VPKFKIKKENCSKVQAYTVILEIADTVKLLIKAGCHLMTKNIIDVIAGAISE